MCVSMYVCVYNYVHCICGLVSLATSPSPPPPPPPPPSSLLEVTKQQTLSELPVFENLITFLTAPVPRQLASERRSVKNATLFECVNSLCVCNMCMFIYPVRSSTPGGLKQPVAMKSTCLFTTVPSPGPSPSPNPILALP